MIVPITFSPSASSSSTALPPALARISHAELVLVELQGALTVESLSPSERDGKLIGTLGIDDAGKTATLRIGHHLLEGRVAQLAKPLAVIQRCVGGESERNLDPDAMQLDNANDDKEESETQQPPSETQTTTGWDAIALIKRKIVFSKRPSPVVGRPS
ncbi:chromosome transmission fidelity protein 8 [Mycena amicta]|nr:chromosome transmission fidelity protein 8 [Mycena amicta]